VRVVVCIKTEILNIYIYYLYCSLIIICVWDLSNGLARAITTSMSTATATATAVMNENENELNRCFQSLSCSPSDSSSSSSSSSSASDVFVSCEKFEPARQHLQQAATRYVESDYDVDELLFDQSDLSMIVGDDYDSDDHSIKQHHHNNHQDDADEFSKLPNDMFLAVAKYLAIEDVVNVQQASKQMNEVFSDKNCWKEQYLKRYRYRPENWALAASLPFTSDIQKKAIKPPIEGWKIFMKTRIVEDKNKFNTKTRTVTTKQQQQQQRFTKKKVVLTFNAEMYSVENISDALEGLSEGDVCILESGTYYGQIRLPAGIHLRGTSETHVVTDDEPAVIIVVKSSSSSLSSDDDVEACSQIAANVATLSNISLWRHRAAQDGSIGDFGIHPKHTACVYSLRKDVKLHIHNCDIVSAGEGICAHNCDIIDCDISTALSGIVLQNGTVSGCSVTSAIAEDQKGKIDLDSEASFSGEEEESGDDTDDDVQMLGFVSDHDEEDTQSIHSAAGREYASIVILGCEDKKLSTNETVDIRNTRIIMNSSHGVSCLDGANVTIVGCLIANNNGGGVYVGKDSWVHMRENLIALNRGVGLAVFLGGWGYAANCEIRDNNHTGIDVSLGAVKERNDVDNFYHHNNALETEYETDDEEYESELMSFLLAQRERYAITHRLVLKECLVFNNGSNDVKVSGGAHLDLFDCIIPYNQEDATTILVESDSFLRISP